MKKSLLALSLLLAACNTTPAEPGDDEGNGAAGTLPEITGGPVYTLWQDEDEIPGIQGSYCDATMCVDKISHVELIKESMMDFWPLSPEEASDLIFKIEEPASTVLFQVLSGEDGTNIMDCDFIPEKISETEYALDLCDELEGEYILSGAAYYAAGRDGTYYFPIGIYAEPSRD